MEVSMYYKLSDDELNNLHGQLTEKYGKNLMNEIRPFEERKLTALVAKQVSQDKQEQEITSVKEFVKEYLYRQLKETALITYLAMDKRKDFGVMGEQRISISFCRNILNIPNNREVTQFDADRFRRVLAECDKRNGNKSGDEYIAILKNASLELFENIYQYHSLVDINVLLKAIDADYYIFGTHKAPYGVKFIFGPIEKKDIAQNKAVIMQKEYIRFPQFVLSIAAEVFEDTTMIRQEACEVIFYNKWQKFYDQSKAESKRALHHTNSAIREGIKTKALALYNVSQKEDVLRIKDIFIEEMIDGILWHEMGHHVSHTDMDPLHKAFLNNFVEGDNIGNILGEALADWAPVKDQRKGAFSRFCELAKTDIKRATRDIYVYMSDGWYVDETEEFMGLMSNVLVGLAMYFINADSTVDFDRLVKEKDQIYAFLQKRYKILFDKLQDIIYKSSYEVGIHKIDYKVMEKKAYKMYQNTRNARPLEELKKFPPFWINLVGYLREFSKEGWRQYQDVLNEEAGLLEQMILKVITKGNEEKYKNSLREYITERAREIGLIKVVPEIDHNATIQKACDAVKMPKKIREQVQNRFTEIRNGKNYDISISYEGEKDPFIAVLQEMLLKSDYGEIKAGMLIGEYYNSEAEAEERKEYIKGELETLRDQLESEMYPEIDTLRVNDKYQIRPMVEELLTTVAFFDGHKLAEKIKSVEFTTFANDALMEVFIPLKRGYMDWNTSQSVWRVNQDLRPDEFMLQWTVDRVFLEALAEAYY
jgi:hypothetical protein